MALLWLSASLVIGSQGWAAESVEGWAGGLDGVRHWIVPDTPNGLRPTQSWHATGSAPNGDIYVAGSDHVTNAALYRLQPSQGTFRYVGDARSASQAAQNWQSGETAQKFHTRPLWYRGRVYLATMDRSELNDEYLSRRGFHWYAYDPIQETFTDLSASESGGTGADHGSIVTITADPRHNVIYGAAVPIGEIFQYDVARGRTRALGRPPSYNKQYLYVGRMMWVDSRSRLYFTAGNPDDDTYKPSIYEHIHYYDPVSGFGELTEWTLQEQRAIEVGQCLPDQGLCFFSDSHGHVYRFEESGPSWSILGRAETIRSLIYAFHVSANGQKAYIVTSLADAWAGTPNALYEFDLITGTTRKLCSLVELDPKIAHRNYHTGYDAWDKQGRFYISSFDADQAILEDWHENIIVTGIDPVRLKVALNLLPFLTEVSVHRVSGSREPRFIFTRTGSTSAAQEVLYKVQISQANQTTNVQRRITIPAGAVSVSATLEQLWPSAPALQTSGVVSVIPNDDDYITGAEHEATY